MDTLDRKIKSIVFTSAVLEGKILSDHPRETLPFRRPRVRLRALPAVQNEMTTLKYKTLTLLESSGGKFLLQGVSI